MATTVRLPSQHALRIDNVYPYALIAPTSIYAWSAIAMTDQASTDLREEVRARDAEAARSTSPRPQSSTT
jgi:hypothetical protein